jgi:hypothetical protein
MGDYTEVETVKMSEDDGRYQKRRRKNISWSKLQRTDFKSDTDCKMHTCSTFPTLRVKNKSRDTTIYQCYESTVALMTNRSRGTCYARIIS